MIFQKRAAGGSFSVLSKDFKKFRSYDMKQKGKPLSISEMIPFLPTLSWDVLRLRFRFAFRSFRMVKMTWGDVKKGDDDDLQWSEEKETGICGCDFFFQDILFFFFAASVGRWWVWEERRWAEKEMMRQEDDDLRWGVRVKNFFPSLLVAVKSTIRGGVQRWWGGWFEASELC